MAFDAHLNFAIGLVATAPSPASSGISLVLAAGQGALFPAPSFNAVICPVATQPNTLNAEIVRVTSISTDTLTITRIQESSNARTILIGAQVYAGPTVKTFTDIENNAILGNQAAEHTTSGPLDWGAQANPLIIAAQIAANPVLRNYLLDADANPALEIDGSGKIQFGAGGATALDTNLYRNGTGILQTDGNIAIGTAGKGLQIESGSNCKVGTATLVGGTVTVANTSVTANSVILIVDQSGGSANLGSIAETKSSRVAN